MVDKKMAQRSSTHRGIVLSSIDLPVKLLKTQKTQIENSEKMRRTFFHRFLRSGAETQRVHDYRIRQVRDLELRLLYRRRRYVCLVCGKRFAEKTFDIRLPMAATTPSKRSNASPSASESSPLSGQGFCLPLGRTPIFDKNRKRHPANGWAEK